MKRKDSAALFGFCVGVVVQGGDRFLVARAMRSQSPTERGADVRHVVGVFSPFYLLPAVGSGVAVLANRLRRNGDRGAIPRVLAVGLVACGFVLRAWSLRTLGEFYSPVVEIRADHRVVQDGPYRFVRHPGYLAGLLQSVGVGLAFDTIVGAAATTGSFLSVFIPRIHEEEGALVATLGDDYREFCKHRSRLLPGIW